MKRSRFLIIVLALMMFSGEAAAAGGPYSGGGPFAGNGSSGNASLFSLYSQPSTIGGLWATSTGSNVNTLPFFQATGTFYWNDYVSANNLTINPYADNFQNIENFLLDSQTKCYQLKNETWDNTDSKSPCTVVFPRQLLNTWTTIAVPPEIQVGGYAIFMRDGSHGTPSGSCNTSPVNWDGTDCGDLGIAQEPTIIFADGSDAAPTITVDMTDSSGNYSGSGIVQGGAWQIKTVSAASPGSGYTAGEVCHIANPESKFGAGATITVGTVNGSGGVTAWTYAPSQFSAAAGSYALPYALRKQQYSKAAYIAATGVTTFDSTYGDGSTAYLVVNCNGAGSGASVTVTDFPDWSVAGGTTYQMVFAYAPLQAEGLFSNINLSRGSLANDNTTYGPTFADLSVYTNASGDQINVQKGYYALWLTATDQRYNIVNPVASEVCLKTHAGGDHIGQLTCDTMQYGGMEIDNTVDTSVASGIMFNNGSAPAYTEAAIDIGQHGSGASSGISDFSLAGAFNIRDTGAPAALYLDYMQGGNSFNVAVNNTDYQGNAVTYPTSVFAQFGTHNNSTDFILDGSINGVAAGTSIFSGTVPLAAIHVWNDTCKGFAGPGGVYMLYGSGAPTSGATGTCYNNAAPGSIYTNTTSGTLYVNTGSTASPTWSQISTGSGTASQRIVFQLASTSITVGNDQTNWAVMTAPGTINKAWAVAKTAPTGQALIFDIQKSTNGGVSFTSLWSVNPSNKIQLAGGANTGNTTSFDTTTYNAGDIFRIDVDQIGSGTPGGVATVSLGVSQ